MVNLISQIAITLFGCSAIWFVGRKEQWRKWGYLLGLLSQPFWFYTVITHKQWGLFTLCCWYAYSWGQGVWNYIIHSKAANSAEERDK